MKIVTFSEGQSGEEWLDWRKNGIGGSDIGVINGSNPYKTPLQLWEIKCGFREEDPINPAMQHGITHEDIARQWINENFNLHLKPICVEDSERPHFKASLDGYDFDQEVLCEIKCPISEKTLDNARLTQSVPAHWIDQIQWMISLTNPKRAILAIWDHRYKTCITMDMFGSATQMETLQTKALSFWHQVQVGKPPEPQDKDVLHVEDPELAELISEYKDVCNHCKGLTARKKELKEKIEPFGKGYNFEAYGVKVSKCLPPKSYDMEKMRLDGINVDDYLKPSKSYYYKIYTGRS